MVKSIDSISLRAALLEGNEIAIIDPREEGPYGHEHILLAVNVPLSRFELEIRDLVPRRATRLVLCDGDDGFSERALLLLNAAGYTDIAILYGGTKAWRKAGFELFSGRFTPSQMFGAFLSNRENTPKISAHELKARIDAEEKVLILDSRPPNEYRKASIPGAIDTPVAEIVYRIRDLAPDPETLVVVNCAGKTRSVLGTQSLIYAGLVNQVAALEHGTMGWYLAGLELDHNANTIATNPITPEADSWGRVAATKIAEHFGVQSISIEDLESWKSESEERALYIFDVRYPEEYEIGHLPGSRPAPGGQIAGSGGHYMAIQNARIVLVDDNGVRATVIAGFLLQQGFKDVRVLEDGINNKILEHGAYRPLIPELEELELDTCTPNELKDSLTRDAIIVIDFATSSQYFSGHIPGAWWVLRSRIAEDFGKLPKAHTYVLTSEDDQLARLGASDLFQHTNAKILVLEGGTDAWRARGMPITNGLEHIAGIPNDLYTIERLDDNDSLENKYWRYINWQQDLLNKQEPDGTLKFP